ncbi:MAG: hypothetical protein J0L80_02625 [Chitinophagales bacterium]|nr:hypothetical protein [Chitinophagales bacterium]
MIKLHKVFCTSALTLLSAVSAFAQKENKAIKIEVPATFKVNTAEDIRCYLYKPALGKNKPVIQIFAQNNQRGMPMMLLRNKTELPVRLLALARNTPYHLAFRAATNEVLYQKQGSSPYSWSWRGRAKAPASPIVAIPGERIESIKWWATVKVGNKTYTSDTLTTTIE